MNDPLPPSKDSGINCVIDQNTIDEEIANYDYKDDEDGEKSVSDRHEILEARRKWALIHFYALRPAFSVSLLLYIASITSARGALTFESGVVDPIRNLGTFVQMESKGYTTCAQQSTLRTTKQLEILANQDRERIGNIFESNKKIIQRVEEYANNCLDNTHKARESLIQWREDEMEIPWLHIVETDNESSQTPLSHNSATCTALKRNQTERLLGRDFHLARGQLNTVLDSYVSDSHNSLQVINDYAVERFDYDWNYFIMKRIQPAIDFLSEQSVHIQTMGIDLDYNITEIEEMIQEQINVLQRELEQAKQHIDKLQEKLVEFRSSINALYIHYSELYDRLINAAETVYGFLPPGASLPDVFDLSGLPIADYFLPPSGLTWPELELEYSDIQKKVQETAQACIKIVIQTLDKAQIQSVEGLREAIQQFSQGLLEILELKDYDPPNFQGSRQGIFDINQELEFHSSLGQDTLNWTEQILKELQLSSSSFNNLTVGTIETPDIAFDYNFTEERSTTFEILNVMIPKLKFIEFVFNAIAFLGTYAFVLDILCGFLQWWRLSSMYENGALPSMPEIDYGDDDQDARERPQTNYKILFLILKSFLNPFFVGFLCVFLSIGIVVINFWIPHIEQMCVHSSNGTWLANNMIAPALLNYATVEGNVQYLLAEHSCFAVQNQLCSNIGFEVENRVNADNTALKSLQAKHNRSVEALRLMTDCIDTFNMTDMVNESCCGLKGFNTVDCSKSPYKCPIDTSTNPPSAYRPFATYLKSPSCLEHVYEWNLDDKDYDCTSLKEATCHIPCNGVNDKWIKKYTVQTDCEVELWIINSCRFWSAVMLHFISLYGTCSLIYFGCRDLYWREISPDSIRLRTHLRENGNLARGYEFLQRSESVSNEIKWFERKAKLQLFMGIIMLWTYFIVVVVLIVRG